MKKDSRTYADRRRYLISAVKKRRRELRLKAIAYKGGQCQVCGYAKCIDALEFHHLEEGNKDFGISSKGYIKKLGQGEKGTRQMFAGLRELSSRAPRGCCSFPEQSGLKHRVNSGKPKSYRKDTVILSEAP